MKYCLLHSLASNCMFDCFHRLLKQEHHPGSLVSIFMGLDILFRSLLRDANVILSALKQISNINPLANVHRISTFLINNDDEREEEVKVLKMSFSLMRRFCSHRKK